MFSTEETPFPGRVSQHSPLADIAKITKPSYLIARSRKFSAWPRSAKDLHRRLIDILLSTAVHRPSRGPTGRTAPTHYIFHDIVSSWKNPASECLESKSICLCTQYVTTILDICRKYLRKIFSCNVKLSYRCT